MFPEWEVDENGGVYVTGVGFVGYIPPEDFEWMSAADEAAYVLYLLENQGALAPV